MLGASGVSASLSGAGEAGLSGGEQVKPVLQVHWTLPATSVQHGPDLWTDDWAATSRLPWPSLAPCPPHTSASHSASKIPRASQEEPACHARTRKAQLQHGPWVHRFGRRYEQGPHPRTWAPRADASPLPPAHLGFVPQAQFIFAKNCSQVWAEALNGFTQCSGGQGSQELPEEAKGEKDVEKDHEPKPEAEPEAEKEPELGQEAEQVRWRRLRQSPAVGAGSPCLCVAMHRLAAGTEPDHQPHCPASLCYKPGAESVSRFSSLMSPHKASPYSMDDSDPRKFFMSGERVWVMTKGLGMCREGTDCVCPPPRLHWLRAQGPLPLRLQLSCAQQPGAAGVWRDEVSGQVPEGS